MKGYTYPRSLSEAFNDADRAECVYGPYKTGDVGWTVSVWATCVIAACVVLALIGGVL